MGTGIYLFEDVDAMMAHMENLRKMEQAVDFVSDLKMQVWDVQEGLSRITKAPI
jgi:hypothetical protein